MKIEVLYPEIANLYGDLFNIKYLEPFLIPSSPDSSMYTLYSSMLVLPFLSIACEDNI